MSIKHLLIKHFQSKVFLFSRWQKDHHRRILNLSLLLFISLHFFSYGCTQKEIIFRTTVNEIPENAHPLNVNYYSQILIRNIYEPLIREVGGRDVPVLADYWYQVSDSTYAIVLKENIRYSDGSFMTVNDVKHSIDMMYIYGRALIDLTIPIDVEIQNDLTLLIHTASPTFPLHLFHNMVIHKDVDAVLTDDISEIHLLNTVGTGEYELHEALSDKIILKKNVFHRDFKKNKKSPDVVELIYEPDIEQRYALFKENKVDFLSDVPLSAYNEVFNTSSFTTFSSDRTDVILLLSFDVLNAESPDTNLSYNPLLDKKVRYAIAHAIDMNSFVKNKLYGKAKLLSVPALPRSHGYPIHLENYRYDLEYSKSLMAEAGLSEGFEMKVRVMSGPLLCYISEYIKDSLKDINIDVTLDYKSTVEFDYSNTSAQPIAIISGFNLRNRASLYRAFESYMVVNNQTGNRTRTCAMNPKQREIINRIRNMNELDTNLPALRRELVDIVYDDLFILPLFQPYDVFILNKKVYTEYDSSYRFINFKTKTNKRLYIF